jgi:uncharacterized protein YuzB (UPF0349 family)
MSTWVIQTNLLDQLQIDEMKDAILKAGGIVVGATVIPFSDGVGLSAEIIGTDVIPYGSTKLTHLGVSRKWSGVYFNDDFCTTAWNLNRTDMLNQNGKEMTVRQLISFADENYDIERESDVQLFIRPVNDLKEFNGTVTTVREIRMWMSSVDSGNFSFSEDTMVALSAPVELIAEQRWFIVDGKVIDGSQYRQQGYHVLTHIPEEQWPELYGRMQKLADVWLPCTTCVMDLAILEDHSVKVIEFNCINSSGFYKHDVQKIVNALNK